MVFVDSNVILDVITADLRWQAWSEEQLCGWLNRGPLLTRDPRRYRQAFPGLELIAPG
jgi:predicted nucleic acid-binding protein